MIDQKTLISKNVNELSLPSTRYVGSKQKLVPWIWENIKDLNFNSFLDLFGGTGSVGYCAKWHGKKVTYNDFLKSNYYLGLALIENNKVTLSNDEIEYLLTKHENLSYPNFIEKTFEDIYYTPDENRWLDMIIKNIEHFENKYKKALAYSALSQACLVKRPFNLFHRKNLYVRFAKVKRGFGNKTTWDKPFEDHFKKFAAELNSRVFSNNLNNTSINSDVFEIENGHDLIYLDPPYISSKRVSVDYYQFYHFLEGIMDYDNWPKKIDYNSKHKRLIPKPSVWTNPNEITSAFDSLVKKFEDRILVVSYRSDGIPSENELKELLYSYKKDVQEIKRKRYKYALSKNGSSEELLYICK